MLCEWCQCHTSSQCQELRPRLGKRPEAWKTAHAQILAHSAAACDDVHSGGSRGPAPLLLRPADAPAARGGEQHAPRQRLPPGCWLLVLVICSCLSVMAIIGSRQRDEGVLAHTGACRAAVAKLRAERRASRILPLCLLQTPCCTRQNSGAAQCTHPLLARRARQQQRGAWCQAACAPRPRDLHRRQDAHCRPS